MVNNSALYSVFSPSRAKSFPNLSLNTGISLNKAGYPVLSEMLFITAFYKDSMGEFSRLSVG
jgi:hypothetical protein